MTKDIAKTTVMRVVSDLANRIRKGQIVYLNVPHVGLFVSKSNIVGVKFEPLLIAHIKVHNFLPILYITL